MLQIKYICLLLILCLNAACSRHALHDAQIIVSQADSLWHAGLMYGIDHGDSTSLAQAYETLGKFSLPFREGLGLGSSYTHACYHYGRLLRKKDDPVSAMQVFINATHSHTRDYHILGRIYSNMGDLCHLAGVFPLSYDMYEKSGEMYLRNGDTLLYYYALNAMSWELAEQGKKDSTLNLISEIEENCTDKGVLNKIKETKVLLYRNIELYDSVLFAIKDIQINKYNQSTFLTLKSSVLWGLGQYDSALIYARYIIDLPNASPQDKYNMYYIIIHGDTTLSNEEVKILSEQRADLEIKNLVPLHKCFAQAVQLLQQDLNRKPNYVKIAFIILGFAGLLFFLCLAMVHLNRKHKQVNEKINYQLVQEENLQLQAADYYKKQIADLENSCEALRKSKHLKKDLNWDDYNSMCSIVNLHMNGLVNKLMKFPNISSNDIRLCTLVLLDISYSEIANMLNLSPKSIAKLKSITAHKLNTTMKDLRTILIKIVCEN